MDNHYNLPNSSPPQKIIQFTTNLHWMAQNVMKSLFLSTWALECYRFHHITSSLASLSDSLTSLQTKNRSCTFSYMQCVDYYVYKSTHKASYMYILHSVYNIVCKMQKSIYRRIYMYCLYSFTYVSISFSYVIGSLKVNTPTKKLTHTACMYIHKLIN